MTIFRAGAPVLQNGQPVTHPYLFHDDFDRASLGSGWVNGHDYDETFAPLGIIDDALACTEPTNHNNEGEQSPGYPWDGIGCIWRETGVVDVQVSIRVSALNDNFREATPLLHVTPGSSMHGVGAWLSSFGPAFGGPPAAGVVFVSYIGNPVTLFGLPAIAIASFTRPTTDSVFTIRSVNGMLTIYLDGQQLSMSQDFGSGLEPIDAFEVHEDLVASTMHGVAIDCHFDDEKDAPMVDDIWITAVDS